MGPGLRVAGRSGGEGAEGRERRVELLQHRAFACEKIRAGRALVLPEETVFLQGALVDGVAEPMVSLEGFGLGHGVEAVLGPAGSGLVAAGWCT